MCLNRRVFYRQYANRCWRGAVYLAIVIFSVQLFCLGFHNHELTEESSDCVSCVLAAHLPSGTPSLTVDVAPTLTILFYQLAPTPLYFFLVQQSYLIPRSQAPPRRNSTQ